MDVKKTTTVFVHQELAFETLLADINVPNKVYYPLLTGCEKAEK